MPIVLAAAIPCWSLANPDRLSQDVSVGLWLVWLLLGIPIAFAVHEAGHLICALVTGMSVRQVTIGAGPLLFRRRLGETWFELRLLPTLGYVINYPATVVRRGRIALFVSGGVLANAAVIAGVTTFAPWSDDVTGPIVLTQAWLILVALMPSTVRIDGNDQIGSDGRQLWQLLSMKSGEPTAAAKLYAQLIANYAHGGEPPPPTQASLRIMYQVFRLDRWTNQAKAREFVEALLRELQRGGLPAAEEVLVIDTLLTHAFVLGDPILRPRLDALSERALTLAPSATLSGSRGSALVEIGRYAEGKVILEELIMRDGLSPFDIFMTEAHLARAEQGLGNRDAAIRWAAAARRSAEACGGTTEILMQQMLARMEAGLVARIPDDRRAMA